jgi:hypothetical protein
MQFGDDWPGLFIRGDQSFGYACALDDAMDVLNGEVKLEELEPLARQLITAQLAGLLEDLKSADTRVGKPVVKLKRIKDCLP